MTTPTLRAPFPWFGGKSRAAHLVWAAFGEVANYVEPFAGSLAVLLARPTAPRIETVNDLDCYLANFWRAVQAAPEAVAQHADWPVNEADLHARHLWLVNQGEFRERMKSDPDFYDAKIAGWWVWGLSAWLGSGWCDLPMGGGGDHTGRSSTRASAASIAAASARQQCRTGNPSPPPQPADPVRRERGARSASGGGSRRGRSPSCTGRRGFTRPPSEGALTRWPPVFAASVSSAVRGSAS